MARFPAWPAPPKAARRAGGWTLTASPASACPPNPPRQSKSALALEVPGLGVGDVRVVADRAVPQPLRDVAHVRLDDPHALRGGGVRDDRDHPHLVERDLPYVLRQARPLRVRHPEGLAVLLHHLAHARRRLLALRPRAGVPDAVERPDRGPAVDREEERGVAEHVVGAPLGLEVDLVLVGPEPGGGEAALHLLDLAPDPDLLPLLDDHLGDLGEGQEPEIRGQGKPQTTATVGAQAIPLAILLGQ